MRAEKRVEDWDRILRASVPERWKSCASPVGAVQSYIAELEERLDVELGGEAYVSTEQATDEKGYPHPGNTIDLVEGGQIRLQYGHQAEGEPRNGCYTTDVIQGLIDNLSVYQQPGHPMRTRETAVAITKLEEALMWINRRKQERSARGVHQTDRP